VSQALAVTFVVAGVIAASWAVLMWKKRRGAAHNWVVLLMVLAGLGIGTGMAGLVSVNLLNTDIGFIPLWLIVVLVLGFGFFLEIRGWGPHHTRTPLLGASLAVILAMAVGQGVAVAATHGIRNVQVTSHVTRAKG
jgi:hypothetical protein